MSETQTSSPKRLRDPLLLGIVGATAFALAFALGTGVNLATGIPLTGGIVNATVTAAALTIGICAVPRWGSGLTLWLIFSILSIPTVTLGPPGFHKVLIGLLGGLIWDVSLSFLPKSNWGRAIAAALMTAAIMIASLLALTALELPGADRLKQALPFLLAIYLPLGGIGGWLGAWLFEKKLKGLPIFRQ